MAIYNMEKVLYLASKSNFNVDKREWINNDTTICALVRKAVSKGWLTQVAHDDCDVYFKTTIKGEIKLCKLQIKWRESHGKDASAAKLRLEVLQQSGNKLNSEYAND